MISEEEIIAKYVKEKHPEILSTTDFAAFNLQERLKQMFEDLKKPAEDIMEKLNEAFGGIKDE